MAMGQSPVHTPETANGARLQALLIDEGTPLVRKVFDREVSRMNPSCLQDQLQIQRYDLECYLDPSQSEKVYPGGGVANSSEHFDIALLSLLLGRLCHIRPPRTGWNQEPPAGDKSPIAWIIRLKLFRNENYAHITNTALSNTKFEKLWNKLSDIMSRLGGDKNRILKRKTESIDPEQEKKNREKLKEIYRQDNEVKDLVVAQGAQAAAQLSSLGENIQKQTSKNTKTREEMLHHFKINSEQLENVKEKCEEVKQAIITEVKNQPAEKTAKETQNTLQMVAKQQQEMIENQKAMADMIAGMQSLQVQQYQSDLASPPKLENDQMSSTEMFEDQGVSEEQLTKNKDQTVSWESWIKCIVPMVHKIPIARDKRNQFSKDFLKLIMSYIPKVRNNWRQQSSVPAATSSEIGTGDRDKTTLATEQKQGGNKRGSHPSRSNSYP